MPCELSIEQPTERLHSRTELLSDCSDYSPDPHLDRVDVECLCDDPRPGVDAGHGDGSITDPYLDSEIRGLQQWSECPCSIVGQPADRLDRTDQRFKLDEQPLARRADVGGGAVDLHR